MPFLSQFLLAKSHRCLGFPEPSGTVRESEILTIIEEDRVGDYRSKLDKDCSVGPDGMHLRVLKELVIITARLLIIFHLWKVVVIRGDFQMTGKWQISCLFARRRIQSTIGWST